MIQCTFENGNQANLRHISVHAIAIQDQKLLMVKRGLVKKEPGKYDLPGGLLDRDETLEQGCLRELYEETGYRAKIRDLAIILDRPVRTQVPSQIVAFYFWVILGERSKGVDNEIEKIQWMDLDSIPSRSGDSL